MQVNSVQRNNPNFTSVIPVKVYIDGLPSVDRKNIQKAIKALSNILVHGSKGKEQSKNIIKIFINAVKDFKFLPGVEEPGRCLRNYIFKKEVDAYLFTGSEAWNIDALARKIGPAKSKGLDAYGTSKTFEASARGNSYFDKILEYIKNPKLRLKEVKETGNGPMIGDPMRLNVFMTSSGEYGKSNFKLNLENIGFENIKKQA
ncbi:MAG TPA: hypothetical protein PKI94_03255 [Candidatus Gastranaerophilaceae bacterium]|nr:hypothetical protein [Candidatus Gastranaerophilaceae bacterium]